MLTDNGGNYLSGAFRETAAARGVGLRRTRPYRPQTNGKAEAFIKILQAEWAYRRRYDSNRERLDALPAFLREYNHDRPHGGIGGAVPASRLSTTSLGSTPSPPRSPPAARGGAPAPPRARCGIVPPR